MRILLSSFAFLPNVGSEAGVGWRWAVELSKSHEVTVVTDESRHVSIKASKVEFPKSLEVVYFRPRWLRFIPLNSWTAQFLYALWQFCLLPFAMRLHKQRKFDVAVHITYGVFRHPSFLGYLGIPFVFGPLGGGEDAPLVLKKSIRGREKMKEFVRTFVNKLALFDPFLWAAYSKAALILTKTEDTRKALPWPFRDRAVVFPEIGIDAQSSVVPASRLANEPLRVLFVGRLLGWKGAHLAIRAVAEAIKSGVLIDFFLVGKGPYEKQLRTLASELGVYEKIKWISHIPQAELFALYGSMHCFLFPSLHDSSGNVVLEAQAKGLPVVCLDLGGPATLVSPGSSIVVSTKNADEAVVVTALADAISTLFNDEASRWRMANSAVSYASTGMSWEGRVSGMLDLLHRTGHRSCS